MEEEYETVALVKPEIFVYRIPPLGTTRGHKAADWKLDAPDWTGRMKLVAVGKRLELRLEDKTTGALYAKCPIDAFPGVCIEPVVDSSRYFVIRLKNDAGQTAFVGCGFADRGDSFDLNVALQDHFKYIDKSAELAQQEGSQKSLDLAFKEGQTISIKIGKKSPDGQAQPTRPRPQHAPVGGSVPLLPPPPGSSSIKTKTPIAPGAPNNSIASDLLWLMPVNERKRHRPIFSLYCVVGLVVSFHRCNFFEVSGVVPDMTQRTTFDHLSPSQNPNPFAVRRLQKDYQRLLLEPIDGIVAKPDDENILVWHYVIKGSPDTPYEGGYYYGKILFQPDFPWKPPSICMLTPNGRFKVNQRLCLSISDYHPESWNPGWTVSSILVGLHSFMNEDAKAVGVICTSPGKRRQLAAASREWNLNCPDFLRMFPNVMDSCDQCSTSTDSTSCEDATIFKEADQTHHNVATNEEKDIEKSVSPFEMPVSEDCDHADDTSRQAQKCLTEPFVVDCRPTDLEYMSEEK